jgi:predicted DCC family thiol-disulfide oxidoreductase YuxK
MKTLDNHTIIYDDECPMCTNYTGAFVRTGMLDQKGREAFSTAAKTEGVDWNKARNEIALIDRTNNTVIYGVEAIITILTNRFQFVGKIARCRPVLWMLKKLYSFISFNRKVIMPGEVFEGVSTCTPDMNYFYRWMYIVAAWLITSVILASYSKLAVPIVPQSGFFREFVVCGGQIIFQGIIVLVLRRDRAIHYLGNLMTVSLGGSMLLTPMLIMSFYISEPGIYIGYFMLVVALMFLEHLRRVKILELGWTICLTWALYRFIALFFIL